LTTDWLFIEIIEKARYIGWEGKKRGGSTIGRQPPTERLRD